MRQLHWSRNELVASPNYGTPGRGAAGRLLVEHFFDLSDAAGRCGTLRQAWSMPNTIYSVCTALQKKRSNLSKSAIIRSLTNDIGFGPRIIAPGVYTTILKHFSVSPTSTFDACPMLGTKLIAVAAAGAKFYYAPKEYIDQPHMDLARHLGVTIQPYNGQRVDVAFCDRMLMPIQGRANAVHSFIFTPDPSPGCFAVHLRHTTRYIKPSSYFRYDRA
jgi:hypothetical protein